MTNTSSQPDMNDPNETPEEFRKRVLEAIFTISTSPAYTLQDIAGMAVSRIATVIHADTVVLFKLTADVTSPLVRYDDGKLYFDTAESLSGNASVINSSDYRSESGDNRSKINSDSPTTRCRACISIPLKNNTSEIVGYICAERNSENVFSNVEKEAFEIFGQYVSTEIVKNDFFEESLRLQKKQLLSQVISGAVHEIRNPLNGLAAVSEALFSKLDDSARYERYKEHFRNQIRRLSEITESIQAIGRLPGSFNLTPVNICALLEETVSDWQSNNEERSSFIQLSLPEEYRSLQIAADSRNLQRAFKNIIDNAKQHTPEQGNLAIHLSPAGPAHCSISLRDNGSGIPRENLNHIFVPFFTTRNSAAGLGLNIARNIIENHGGSIRILNNAPPPGTSVELLLPLYTDN